MRKFTVNEKQYTAKPFDFNMICDLEDMGITISDSAKKPMSLVRAYFGICTEKDKEYAGKEMEEHVLKGGTLEDVISAMTDEMDKSDFFRKLKENSEQKAPEDTKKAQIKTK